MTDLFTEITTIYDSAVTGAEIVITDHQRQLARRTIGSAFAFIAPPVNMPTAAWADEHVYLPQEMTAKPGKWRTDERPFLRGIADAFDDPMIETISIEKASRMGITMIILGYIGKRCHLDPCAIMYAQQTLGMAKTFNAKILTPYVRSVRVLRDLFIPEKSRTAGASTIFEKRVPGGTLSLVGGNVPTGFRMVFQEVVIGDDLDGWAWVVGKEGDPVENMIGRTRDVWNRKIILASKPTIKGFSRIDLTYQQSDKRLYHVPCPMCDHGQVLRWGGKDLDYGIKWTGDDPYSAYYLCEQCHGIIRDYHKRAMLQQGQWIPTAIAPRHAGFGELSQLYHPDISFAEMARDFLKAGDNPEMLQVFFNDRMGACWEDKGESLSENILFDRREAWEPDVLPEGIAALTGSADVGGNHIACGIEGWGRGMENWKADYQLFEGDTLLPEVWEDLRKYVLLTWKHYCGIQMRPMIFVIDAGYRIEMVAEFVKSMRKSGVNVIAIVGREQTKSGEIMSGTLPSKKGKHKVNTYTVNDDKAKLSVLARLKIPPSNAGKGGYVHFPMAEWANEDYFNQLLSEKKVRIRSGSTFIEKWIRKPGVRNEPIDVAKYNLAGLIWMQKHKRFDLDKAAESMLARVEVEKLKRIERGEMQATEYFMSRAKAVQERVKEQEQRKTTMPQKKSSWVTNWRR